MKRVSRSVAFVPADASSSPWAEYREDGSNLTVDVFPTTMIVTLANALRRTVTVPYAQEAGLSVPEWRLLALLAHYSPISVSELVGFSGSDKALVSRTLKMLEERQLVEVRPDANGSKKKLDCVITRAGKALHRKVMPIAQARQARVLSVLTQKERTVMFGALQKLHRLCAADGSSEKGDGL